MELIIHLHKTKGKKIYVEPEYEEGIYLYPGEIKKQKLQDGDSVSAETFEKLRKEYAVPRAKKRALGILVKKDCTEKELRDKLTASFNDSQSIEEALTFVREHGYVDDENYAREYLHDKKGRKSYLQIRTELSGKGIAGQILDRVFEEAGSQQEEDIRPQVMKYIRKFPELDAVAVQKTCAHFYRKGYPVGRIRQIIENVDTGQREW